ncbi:conserved hypothetical protein [Lodderomyces elongisporus NRRL YB-4239]|uniref:GPI mannosyltransferase 2 n=1 Tax=Lodderomyces elongisporus (strain ATCC 11503 / CBS 2605 / JCM 1781 / NBRC 1676 / NRRL YB-4239) TaxID=379508 RepID=A5DWE0_LODEL|nr:conserved hypothetical protein [Lodderomyces elongisporus NRRL YB-4239]
MNYPIWSLFCSFSILKILQLVIIYFTPSTFDTSSKLLHTTVYTTSPYNEVTTTILKKLVAWDSVYFNDLFINEIQYEHQFVFCPGWIKLIEVLGSYIYPSIYNDKSTQYYRVQLLSILVSNLLHFTSVLVLFYLTLSIFKLQKLSLRAAKMMILSPAGVFLTTNYSENLSNLLTLLTIAVYFYSVNFGEVSTKSNKSIKSVLGYISSGVIAALNYTVRANGLLLGIMYLFDLYDFAVVDGDLGTCFLTTITGSLLGITFIWQNTYHYFLFCPLRGEWCNKTFPSLFGYAQSHYWSNGFLSYWTPNNIPNFLLAFPVVCWNFISLRYWWKKLPQNRKLTSLVVVNFVLIVSGILFMNVQIMNRVTSGMPLLYWTLANGYEKWWFKYVLMYMLTWNLLQTALFAAFLPPA